MFPQIHFDPSFHGLRRSLPGVAFLGGFLWDAVTLGRTVGSMDLWILAAYLAGAACILWYLGLRAANEAKNVIRVGALSDAPTDSAPNSPAVVAAAPPWWQDSGPYVLLQFLFGGLFSALFIFYFKSSSHLLALLWALGLAGLLVANEFIDSHYRRFTLTWALFGLCAMLLLNFVIPHIVGSISAFWFYLSTLVGAGLAHALHLKTPGQPGRIKPVWGIAAALLLVYQLDVIPPVPLVKRDIAVGHAMTKTEGYYQLQQEKAPWWVFWRELEAEVHLAPGERLYCVSAVFAPVGLSTRLYHRWLHYEENKGWVTYSHIGFNLNGGRKGGYRGYTFKQNLAPGEWKVAVETENGRTVAVHRFDISAEPLAQDAELKPHRI